MGTRYRYDVRRAIRSNGYEHEYVTNPVFKLTAELIESAVDDMAHELRGEDIDPELVDRVAKRVIEHMFPSGGADLTRLEVARMGVESLPLPPGTHS